jgi:hypothetical protein
MSISVLNSFFLRRQNPFDCLDGFSSFTVAHTYTMAYMLLDANDLSYTQFHALSRRRALHAALVNLSLNRFKLGGFDIPSGVTWA